MAELDKLRPVVVMHRDFAGRALNALLVAPLTTTIRDIPTAVQLGPADGIDRDCIASLDNLTLVARERLRGRIGHLAPARMAELCDALSVALACEWPDHSKRPEAR
ncbi:type II toxin-antitoxin system toxin endoribonuclease MazF3 [soil metagenome]